MDLAVSVRELRKDFGGVKAVNGVDLDVKSGEVLALLGPNGAGKTTIVEILEGYRPLAAARSRCSASSRDTTDVACWNASASSCKKQRRSSSSPSARF
jgi:ABC-type branched-subunit amino acid transport system ATPase component